MCSNMCDFSGIPSMLYDCRACDLSMCSRCYKAAEAREEELDQEVAQAVGDAAGIDVVLENPLDIVFEIVAALQ